MKKVMIGVMVMMAVAGTLSALEEIQKDIYTAGEKDMQESVAGHHKFYRLWSGDGARPDDPLEPKPEESEKDNIVRIKNVTAPSMMVMKAKNPDGRAVVLFPGGGYGILAATHEGTEVGEWLNQQGITTIIVKYRCPWRKGLGKHAVALQDAQRAIRLVRANAKEFGIDKNKIGVMGFSAGGHLSVLTLHQYDVPSYEKKDDADKLSSKPNFAILIYPAYLIEDNKDELDPMVATVKDIKMPTYIAISVNDKSFVPGAHKYAELLGDAKVPVDYHLYSRGGHGSGLRGFPWVISCEQWLKDLK